MDGNMFCLCIYLEIYTCSIATDEGEENGWKYIIPEKNGWLGLTVPILLFGFSCSCPSSSSSSPSPSSSSISPQRGKEGDDGKGGREGGKKGAVAKLCLSTNL